MTGVDIHALSGAYALDALDDLERTAFRRHLAECEMCTTEVAELQETTARLADASAYAPPASLRASVLAEIARTRQVGPTTMDSAGRAGRSGRWRRWVAASVAAAVLAFGAGATTYAIQERRVREAGQVQLILGAPDAVAHREPAQGGGEVTVWSSASRGARVVVVTGLTTPDSAHAYQLWLLKDGAPSSAGLLDAGQGSGVRLVTGAPGESLAVTLEPASGSMAPTTQQLATVSLT